MVIRFGNQVRVKCPGCKKFIKNAPETTCPRCNISYRQFDDEHFVAFEEA
jgi:hypothetical protein